jgi:tetratricopeptide (TPR) repeat protein
MNLRPSQQTASLPPEEKLESMVWKFLRDRKSREAVAVCEQLNREYPKFGSGWHTASQLATRLNNPEKALQFIAKALELEPLNNEWRLQKANCLLRSGQMDFAETLVMELSTESLETAYQCASIGMMLSRLERHETALVHYQRAVELQPGHGPHYYNLGTVQRFLGDFTAAEHSLDRAIELNPKDYEAWKLRTDLHQWNSQTNHITDIQSALKAIDSDPRGAVNLHFALAKELEDMEDFERSFHHLKHGADIRRRHMRYQPSGDIDTMQRIQEVYSGDMFDGSIEGCDNAEAVFVIGMPRTGTTLVELILASHSNVFAAGELANFSQQLSLLANQDGVTKEELVEISAGLDFSELGRRYIESTRPITGHTSRFIDKLPLNFLYTGLIHLALPQAKIIHVVRDPMDTCYAMYKTLFKDAYPCSYDLEELGNYYLAYTALMLHWQRVIPDAFYTVQYEELVADADASSRKLLDACELPWEDQCLRFYESASASTTASASQIRQPVYHSSVGKWRRYSSQLQPLIDQFRKAGLNINE